MNRTLVLICAATFCLGLGGCASPELRAYESAQATYEDCLAEFPNEPRRCDIARDAAHQRYEDYERAARTRWPRSGDPDPDRIP